MITRFMLKSPASRLNAGIWTPVNGREESIVFSMTPHSVRTFLHRDGRP